MATASTAIIPSAPVLMTSELTGQVELRLTEAEHRWWTRSWVSADLLLLDQSPPRLSSSIVCILEVVPVLGEWVEEAGTPGLSSVCRVSCIPGHCLLHD